VPGQLADAGWSVHEIGPARHILNPVWYTRAIAIAKQVKPDIVHGAVFEGIALANIIGLRFPTAKIISEETSDPVNRRWTGNFLIRWLYSCSNAVVGVSPSVIDYLRNTGHVPNQKLRLINNAVGDDIPPPKSMIDELRSNLGIRPGDIIIGTVGRLIDSHKRFSDILRAMPAVLSRHASARLLIIGDGPDRAELMLLAEDLGISDAVIFAGYQGKVRDFYHLMDLFVLASAHEAFGLVLVEAMLAGVPIVATAVGGIPFVLNNGECGKLTPPHQPEALAHAISSLIADEGARDRFRKAALSRARSEFSADRYCREVEELYRSLSQKTFAI